MKDYREKIRKLLALAGSANQHEAKAALLKARQLMAEHKISEEGLSEDMCQTVKTVETEISYSARRDPWIARLATTIAENYCCYSVARIVQRTYYVNFLGFEEDVEICMEIFRYALDCVQSEIKRIKKNNHYYSSSYIAKLCYSYGHGFCEGIAKAFEEQQQQASRDGWALVMVIPQEVKEAVKDFPTKEIRHKVQGNLCGETYYRGYREGKKFDPVRRISGVERMARGQNEGDLRGGASGVLY